MYDIMPLVVHKLQGKCYMFSPYVNEYSFTKFYMTTVCQIKTLTQVLILLKCFRFVKLKSPHCIAHWWSCGFTSLHKAWAVHEFFTSGELFPTEQCFANNILSCHTWQPRHKNVFYTCILMLQNIVLMMSTIWSAMSY